MQASDNKGAAMNSLIQSQLAAIEDIAIYFGNQLSFKRLAILGVTVGLNAIEAQDLANFEDAPFDLNNPQYLMDIMPPANPQQPEAIAGVAPSIGFEVEEEEDLAAKIPPKTPKPRHLAPVLETKIDNPHVPTITSNTQAPSKLGFSTTPVTNSPIVELYQKKSQPKKQTSTNNKAQKAIEAVAPQAAKPTPESKKAGEKQTEWEVLMERFEESFIKAKPRFERYSKAVENIAPLKDYYEEHHKTNSWKNFLTDSIATLKYATENRGLDPIAFQKLMDIAYNDLHSEMDRIVAHAWVMVKIWDDRDRLKLGTPKACVPGKTFADIPENLTKEAYQAFAERITAYRLAEKADYIASSEMNEAQRDCFDRAVLLFPNYQVEKLYQNSLKALDKETYLNPSVEDVTQIVRNGVVFADFCHYHFFDLKEQQAIRDRYKAFCQKNKEATVEEKAKIFLDITLDFTKKQVFPDLILF
jgi:hypothetical protein